MGAAHVGGDDIQVWQLLEVRNMWEFSHEQMINATPEQVFKLLVDLPGYRNWNPFLFEVAGAVEQGGVVTGKSVLGRFTASFRHKIFEFVPNRRLCWRDFGLMALFVCGQRSRHLEARGGKTHYRCDLKISGPLAGLVKFMFADGLRRGIVAEAGAIDAALSKPLN